MGFDYCSLYKQCKSTLEFTGFVSHGDVNLFRFCVWTTSYMLLIFMHYFHSIAICRSECFFFLSVTVTVNAVIYSLNSTQEDQLYTWASVGLPVSPNLWEFSGSRSGNRTQGLRSTLNHSSSKTPGALNSQVGNISLYYVISMVRILFKVQSFFFLLDLITDSHRDF